VCGGLTRPVTDAPAMNRPISHLPAAFLIFTIFGLTPVPSPARQEDGARRGGGVRAKDAAGREVPHYKQSHSLVIGISEYDYGWDDLSGVKEDVPSVKRRSKGTPSRSRRT